MSHDDDNEKKRNEVTVSQNKSTTTPTEQMMGWIDRSIVSLQKMWRSYTIDDVCGG